GREQQRHGVSIGVAVRGARLDGQRRRGEVPVDQALNGGRGRDGRDTRRHRARSGQGHQLQVDADRRRADRQAAREGVVARRRGGGSVHRLVVAQVDLGGGGGVRGRKREDRRDTEVPVGVVAVVGAVAGRGDRRSAGGVR